jgi:hypothetical protein
LSCIEKKFHKSLSRSYLTQAIAALESLVEDASSGTLQEPWNPYLVAYVGQKIYQGVNCMQAWKVIPVAGIVASLDAVRNRILSFVLEIEAESPDAGEAAVNSSPVPQEKVHQIFNMYITGNVQDVATGNSNVNQNAEQSSANQGSRNFKEHYQKFISILSDHMQVFGPIVAPFLPALAAIVR